MKKILKNKIAKLAVIVTTCSLLFTGCTKKDDISTLESFKSYNDIDLYSLEYNGDYAFEKFLEVGADSDIELATFINDNLLEGTDIVIEAPGVGCTTFSGKIDSGDRLFARNFDFNSAIPLVVKTNPSHGYKSISTVNLEFIGYSSSNLPVKGNEDSMLPLLAAPYIPLDGVNEKGLAIGVLQINWYPAKQINENKITLPTTTMMRMVLDKAASVDEAIALMRKYNITDSLGSNFHYQIADRTGKSVIVEYVTNPILKSVDMIVVEQEKNQDYQYAENFLLSDMGALLQSQLNPSGMGSKNRYNILKEGLNKNNGKFTDMDDAMDLLKAANQKSTHWSVIYNLNKATTLFASKTKYDKPIEFAI